MPEHRTTEPASSHGQRPGGLAVAEEVLGLVGAAELAMFTRLSADARHAPDLRGRIRLSRMAAGELGNLDVVEDLAQQRGVDFLAAVGAFQGLLVDFDKRTAPNDWWERLIKTYVGYGVVLDYERELAGGLDEEARDALAGVVADNGHAGYVVEVLGPVIAAEAQLAARLALWGRRVVGEALGVVRRTLADHPGLVADDAESARLLNSLAASHASRLGRLGLTA